MSKRVARHAGQCRRHALLSRRMACEGTSTLQMRCTSRLAWVLRHCRQLRLDPHHAEVMLRRGQLPRRLVAAQPHARVQQHRRAVAVQYAAVGQGGQARGGRVGTGACGSLQASHPCGPAGCRDRCRRDCCRVARCGPLCSPRRGCSASAEQPAHLPLKQPSASRVPGVGTSAGGRCSQCARSELTAWPHTCVWGTEQRGAARRGSAGAGAGRPLFAGPRQPPAPSWAQLDAGWELWTSIGHCDRSARVQRAVRGVIPAVQVFSLPRSVGWARAG